MPFDTRSFEDTIEAEYRNLLALSDEAAACALKPGAWSPKEELGHLIDSATNNHVRFVRAALEDDFEGPSYAQDSWVHLHGYRDLEWQRLVELWYLTNALLVQLVRRIPDARLSATCIVNHSSVTVEFLIGDYVRHMRHHLDHILARERITPYPPA